MSSNTNDYNEIITVKENELKSLTQQRLMNLERAVKEREEVLLETIKKLEMLKEDFDYNLTLIDARDKEIQRLESSLISQQKKLKESSLTVETLRQENEYLRSQDSKLREEVEEEKENHRVRGLLLYVRFASWKLFDCVIMIENSGGAACSDPNDSLFNGGGGEGERTRDRLAKKGGRKRHVDTGRIVREAASRALSQLRGASPSARCENSGERNRIVSKRWPLIGTTQ